MEYKASDKTIFWKMKKINAHAEQHSKFRISVSEKNKTTRKEIGPLRLALTVVGFPEY
jgi:hypothetical protein